jgi:hypothetical protein
MSGLVTTPNVARPDEIYERLIALHAGRNAEESRLINARLIMLLINHIGDEAILCEAIALAGNRSAGTNEERARDGQ